MKKKVWLVVLLAMVSTVILLVGCGTGAQEQVSEPVSEAVSEVVSEAVSEEVREVVSEEASEAVVEEEFYSAEEVMALVDDLIVKYPYNDPEHIKCLVIGANLDYIKAEELEIILTTYGYTLEELAELYVSETGVIYDAAISCGNTKKYYSGENNELSEEENFANRITFEAVMLNNDDKEFAREVDKYFLEYSQFSVDAAFKISEFAKLEAVSSGEKIIRSFSKAFSESIVEYGPYEEYISN